ncbi:MAG: hypothetical protein R6X34_06115 [Chloroflexota bacterium]
MSPMPTYSFLPWLRQGVANEITAVDHDPAVKVRATVQVDLKLKATKIGGGEQVETISRPVALYGPGDIVGVDSRVVVRTEPRHWITNFEPNYLACIEFYDEDFPWRYTPAAPDKTNHRLRPWLTLVVLKESEFVEGKNIKGKPLNYIMVDNLDRFPNANDLWAWAHVHVNQSVISGDNLKSSNMNTVLPAFQTILNKDPDLAYSRLVCPRRLEENTAYHAFLLPTFENGRLAGLGLDPAQTPHATASAWSDYPLRAGLQPLSFPVYFRWFFQTGTKGDFEYLVRLLEPKPVDARVGIRDMDVLDPGANMPPIDDADLHGILRLGGALRVPVINLTPDELAEANKYNNWDVPRPHPFQEKLAAFINLADDYQSLPAETANETGDPGHEAGADADPDPLITPPLYGRWHALTSRLLKDANDAPLTPTENWVHELNLDPRFRVTAGFGTGVVQDNQEAYMDAAWDQIGDVLEANRRIRWAKFARESGVVWHKKHLIPLQTANLEKSFTLLAPMQRRVMSGNMTAYYRMNTSVVPPVLTSMPLRRALRPRGRLMTAAPFTETARPDNLLTRINDGEIDAQPPKVTPPGLPTVEQVADQLEPTAVPDWAQTFLKRFPQWRLILIILMALLALLLCTVVLIPVSVVGILLLIWLYRRLAAWEKELQTTEAIRGSEQTPAAVDRMPQNPGFTVTEPGDGITTQPGVGDSPEAVRFKRSLKDVNALLTASDTVGKPPVRHKVNLPEIAGQVITAVNPDLTVPKRTLGTIQFPGWLLVNLLEIFEEAMAYPEFDIPMYKPLVDKSTELFLPNIQLIEQNSITLLETNQRFIEAYMVGLNHEFARELLWREYPTDQRGSYFRQFWDPSSYLNPDPNLDQDDLREKLRDIPPLDHWSRSSHLGDHDHREEGGDKEEEVVLVIRGELLKKYPNAEVYAHRACWQSDDPVEEAADPCWDGVHGSIDRRKERRLVTLTPAEEETPPRSKVKTPLYQAQVAPDIYFFGFDLTAEEAKGETPEKPDDPGWFFIIKERSGEPRFGLDIDQQPALNVWNDLSWADMTLDHEHISVNKAFALHEPGASDEKHPQWEDDKQIAWNNNANAAELAYILYQVPVLVGIHASEMLRAR